MGQFIPRPGAKLETDIEEQTKEKRFIKAADRKENGIMPEHISALSFLAFPELLV